MELAFFIQTKAFLMLLHFNGHTKTSTHLINPATSVLIRLLCKLHFLLKELSSKVNCLMELVFFIQTKAFLMSYFGLTLW
jgi:hypothetical protein